MRFESEQVHITERGKKELRGIKKSLCKEL